MFLVATKTISKWCLASEMEFSINSTVFPIHYNAFLFINPPENYILSFFQSFDIIMNVVEMLQKQFQDSATSLQSVQREYSKMLADRQTLDSQLNENRQVRGERWRYRKLVSRTRNLYSNIEPVFDHDFGLSILCFICLVFRWRKSWTLLMRAPRSSNWSGQRSSTRISVRPRVTSRRELSTSGKLTCEQWVRY